MPPFLWAHLMLFLLFDVCPKNTASTSYRWTVAESTLSAPLVMMLKKHYLNLNLIEGKHAKKDYLSKQINRFASHTAPICLDFFPVTQNSNWVHSFLLNEMTAVRQVMITQVGTKTTAITILYYNIVCSSLESAQLRVHLLLVCLFCINSWTIHLPSFSKKEVSIQFQ